MRALIFSVLAGCSMMHSSSASGPSAPSSSPAATPLAESTEGSEPATPSNADTERHAFLPDDFDAMKGLTVDQAKAEAKKRGHRGEVRVEQLDNFSSTCKANAVCKATDVRGGQSGMGLDEPLILDTNKQSTIAVPD